MMYLFCGSDGQRARAKAFEWVAAAKKKEPNLAYVRLAREDLTSAALEEAAVSGGLFVSRLLVLIDDPFPSARVTQNNEEESEADENGGHSTPTILDEHINALAASDNAVVILAPKLAPTNAKKLAAKAKRVYTFDVPNSRREMARGFNSALVNALATRSRDKLWLEIVRALRAGDPPEMLHGLLHWKARDLMEKGTAKWSPQESRALSLSLIALIMDSRRKGLDLSESLERFALST